MSENGGNVGERSQQRMSGSELTRPDAEPIEVQAHHLLCAVCVRGGCEDPPCGKETLQPLLDAMWEYPYVALKITADLDLNRAHYFDVYEGRGENELPENFEQRAADHVDRRKDLEVCRLLGIVPNTVLPAFWAYRILFERAPTVEGICTSTMPGSADWPQCPHAGSGYFEKVAQAQNLNPEEQVALGEPANVPGIWRMVGPRTRQEMDEAKAVSAECIANADRLLIRPQHLLCILCTADKQEPLVEDNLVELRKRMEQEPDIPVTVTEGCCMVCDCCNVYDPDEHICYPVHIKNQLRDLNILEKLDLAPGATLPARELYARIYERIGSLAEVCGWGDGSNTAPFWAPCGGWQGDQLESAREAGLISGGKADS